LFATRPVITAATTMTPICPYGRPPGLGRAERKHTASTGSGRRKPKACSLVDTAIAAEAPRATQGSRLELSLAASAASNAASTQKR
jgi:hypothetical protein